MGFEWTIVLLAALFEYNELAKIWNLVFFKQIYWVLLNAQTHFKSSELEVVNERLQRELVTLKGLQKMIEKLQDKEKRL